MAKVVKVVGDTHTLALVASSPAYSNGKVIGWGNNVYGQTTIPAQALSNIRDIGVSGSCSIALTYSDNKVIGWGTNSNGQLSIPVAAQSDVYKISVGAFHVLALKADSVTILGWGNNIFGQLNIPATGGVAILEISAGDMHSLALKSDGSVIGWGQNGSGECNIPTAAQSGVVAISAGSAFSLALKNGGVIAWGTNSYGQLGVPVAAQSGVIAISAGTYHSLALKSNGSVVGWGDNSQGQLNIPVEAQSGVVAICASKANNSYALKGDGTIISWGANTYGELNTPAGLVLAAPTNLVANSVTTTSFSMSWSAVANAISYNVYRNGSLIVTQAGTGYDFSGLSANSSNNIAVTANSSYLESENAAVTSVYTLPNVPSALTKTDQTTTSISLSWTAPSGGAASYKVYDGAALVASPVETTTTISGLSANTSHSFTVKAANASGESGASSSVVAWTLPNIPAGLTKTTQTVDSVSLSWTASVGGASSYNVYRDGVLFSSPTGTTATVTGLSGNTSYNFTVKAANATSESEASNIVAGLTLPNAPTNLVKASGDADSMVIQWDTPPNGADSYKVKVNGTIQAVTITPV